MQLLVAAETRRIVARVKEILAKVEWTPPTEQ